METGVDEDDFTFPGGHGAGEAAYDAVQTTGHDVQAISNEVQATSHDVQATCLIRFTSTKGKSCVAYQGYSYRYASKGT